MPEERLHRVEGDEARIAPLGEVDDERSNEPGEDRQDVREHRRRSFVGRRFGRAEGSCMHDGVMPGAEPLRSLDELTTANRWRTLTRQTAGMRRRCRGS